MPGRTARDYVAMVADVDAAGGRHAVAMLAIAAIAHLRTAIPIANGRSTITVEDGHAVALAAVVAMMNDTSPASMAAIARMNRARLNINAIGDRETMLVLVDAVADAVAVRRDGTATAEEAATWLLLRAQERWPQHAVRVSPEVVVGLLARIDAPRRKIELSGVVGRLLHRMRLLGADKTQEQIIAAVSKAIADRKNVAPKLAPRRRKRRTLRRA